MTWKKILALFERHDVFISDTVILESEWVLRYAYDFEPVAICEAFTKLFGLPNVHLSNPTLVAQAIQWHIQGLDFADALHLTQCQQYNQFFTFDDKFVNQAKGLCKCSVLKP
jgi:predicted nucleic-acid-binding protein